MAAQRFFLVATQGTAENAFKTADDCDLKRFIANISIVDFSVMEF